MPENFALIPARMGSERFPNKNIVELFGHPLIAHSIVSALDSGQFQSIIVSTDSAEIAEIATKYGALVPQLRPAEIAQTSSPDYLWLRLAIDDWLQLENDQKIAILRPTSPLRSPETIAKALDAFSASEGFDSLRAIRRVKEHPSKMWRGSPGTEILPYDGSTSEVTNAPVHSSPFQVLEELWLQDASLEIARVSSVRESKTISGNRVLGFELPKFEGLDINYPSDLSEIQKVCSSHPELLPRLSRTPQ